MAGIYNPITNPTGTIRFTIDNVIGNQSCFAPVLTNNTGTGLLVGVNMGLQSAKRTGKYAPARTPSDQFGYFRYFTNSNVRAYKNGSNYTGSYIYWTAGNQFTLSARGSGRINLTANTAPGRLPADPSPEIGTTYRIGNLPLQSDNTHNAEEHTWQAPASAFIRARPVMEP